MRNRHSLAIPIPVAEVQLLTGASTVFDAHSAKKGFLDSGGPGSLVGTSVQERSTGHSWRLIGEEGHQML
jgi:hypothetical protein